MAKHEGCVQKRDVKKFEPAPAGICVKLDYFIQKSAVNHENIAKMFINLGTLKNSLNKSLGLWSNFPPYFMEISYVFGIFCQQSNRPKTSTAFSVEVITEEEYIFSM